MQHQILSSTGNLDDRICAEVEVPPSDVYNETVDDDVSPSCMTDAEYTDIVHDDGHIMDVTDRNECVGVMPISKHMRMINYHFSVVKRRGRPRESRTMSLQQFKSQ